MHMLNYLEKIRKRKMYINIAITSRVIISDQLLIFVVVA